MVISPIISSKVDVLKCAYPLKKSRQSSKENIKFQKNIYPYSSSNIVSFKGIKLHQVEHSGNYAKISFYGYPVHIVDGGNHATNVAHFAKAIEKNMDIELHNVVVTPKDKNVKNLKSLEAELKKLNDSDKIKYGDYVAVPALASISLLNLEDRIKSVLNIDVKLTPETVKINKPIILQLLQTIYINPSNYRDDIKYMDPQEQGIEYAYGVIRELNALRRKTPKIYVPAGHPHDDTIKWLAGKRGLKPELYNYIANGVDEGRKIQKLVDEIKLNNWYTFNLLALSNAEIVTVKESDGLQDYMFAAYDTCITKGARGVYNFSPVRQNNKIVGYSYTDTYTNQYPYEEFPANAEIANISKFVGRYLVDVLANKQETIDFIKYGVDKEKLYKVDDVFTEEEIKNNKIRLQGDYVDSTRKLFFRSNKKGEVIFPKCDCEGSGKPSVLPMWGSCFSVFNVIAEDIKSRELKKTEQSEEKIAELHQKAIDDEKKGYLKGAEYYYNEILKIINREEEQKKLRYGSLADISVTPKTQIKNKFKRELVGVLEKQGKYQDAKNIMNGVMDADIKKYFNNMFHRWGFLVESLTLRIIARDYAQIGQYCEKLGESYPAIVCKWASLEIRKNSTAGQEILKRRAEGNAYIGDLYDKYK